MPEALPVINHAAKVASLVIVGSEAAMSLLAKFVCITEFSVDRFFFSAVVNFEAFVLEIRVGIVKAATTPMIARVTRTSANVKPFLEFCMIFPFRLILTC